MITLPVSTLLHFFDNNVNLTEIFYLSWEIVAWGSKLPFTLNCKFAEFQKCPKAVAYVKVFYIQYGNVFKFVICIWE